MIGLELKYMQWSSYASENNVCHFCR